MRAIAVVIPARDEEAVLPAALRAVATAARAAALPIITVVACDSCSDRTAELADAGGASVVETGCRSAGGARRAGVRAAVALLQDVPPSALWVASTDADSTVHADWLLTHLAAADAGWDAYAGEVHVRDWSGWSAGLSGAYERRYRRPGRHRPVHGANLGVRLDAYLAVGGFPEVSCGEDEILVERLERAGYSVLASPAAPVNTSARRFARASGGFSAHLRDLERDLSLGYPRSEPA